MVANKVTVWRTDLHLQLWVMDPRLVVKEASCKVRANPPPIQPKIVAGKAHQHCAHPKVKPIVVLISITHDAHHTNTIKHASG